LYIPTLNCVSMKKLLLLFLSLTSLSLAYSQHAFLEQGVINKLASADEDDLIPIFIILEDAVDMNTLESDFKSKQIRVSDRARIVMQTLKAKANATQPEIVDFIENSNLAFSQIQRFWISNTVALEACPDLIMELANNEAIARIELNMPQYSLIEPLKGDAGYEKSVGGAEPGLIAIGAPEMWAMGYTGQGRVALTFDTGVWPDHPAFENRYLVNRMPYTATWFGYDSPVPVDKTSNHGTHVSGTILGLDTATADTIGVAYGAYLIATDPIVSNLNLVKPLSEIMLGYEWAMNPDGDENTSNDIPDVINNSWGRDNTVVDQDWTPCSQVVIPVLSAVQAAGIANVFSAGNEGPDDSTIGVPHNINTGLVNSFTVGAVNGNTTSNWPIANFSSRGPSLCGGEGSILIKPEVSAPGVSVRSSIENGEYDVFSGTSMASPHVSGAVLLLKEAFPYLSGEDLLLALYYSATDLGPVGEDNTFGMGMINVKSAFDYLSETHAPVPPANQEVDLELLSIDSPTSSFKCNPFNPDILPIITVRNKGQSDITGISLKMQLNGGDDIPFADESIVLAAGSDTQISLPPISGGAAADMELYIRIDTLEGEYDVWNNHNIVRWKNLPVVNDFPFNENFENGINTDLWTVMNPDMKTTWDTLNNVLQADGTMGATAWMDFRTYSPVNSQKDNLVTPLFAADANEIDIVEPRLTFDLFYRRASSNTFTHDTLAIYLNECVSDDVYNSEIFRQGGTELYTTEVPPSINLPLDEIEWRHVEIPLSLINTETPAFYINFEAINRRGNNLLIDNINIAFSDPVGISERNTPEFNIYPNPTDKLFTISTTDTNHGNSMVLIDLYGRKLMDKTMNPGQNTYNVSHLAPGIYLIGVYWQNGTVSMERLLIQ